MSAATCAWLTPSGTVFIPIGPQPICRENSRASHIVSEPTVETEIGAPLRSSYLLIGEGLPMVSPMESGSLAMAATVVAGTPLARKPMPGPEPSAKSMEFATMACCRRASPPNPMDSTSRPYFAQMPFDRREREGDSGRLADADPVGGR